MELILNELRGEAPATRRVLQRVSPEWRLVFRANEVLRKSRLAALRTTMMNHLYHQRGQL